jgi:hypothetical protein
MMNNDEKNNNTTQTTDNTSDVENIDNKPKADCVNLEDELKGEFKVDCTPLQKLLKIEKMEYVSAGVCAFFHALSDTIAVSLESQIIEMMDEILYKKQNDDNENQTDNKEAKTDGNENTVNTETTFNKFEKAIKNMKFNFDTEDSALFMDGKQSMQNELEQRIITEINKQLETQKQKAGNMFMTGGGQRRYSKKIKLRYGNKKNKTQKGGEEERGYEIPLKLPKHFWEKLISDLRVYLAQAINELISCEALKKHLVSGIYTCAENKFHNKIQYNDYKDILNKKIEGTVKITNESLDTTDKANDFEFKKKLAQRLILSNQDKK